MATGWNEIDGEVAELVESLEVGDIVESDLAYKMWIIEVSERTINISESEDQDVLWITGETPRGGEYAFFYWSDPTVKNSEGEIHDWDHAVHTKRYRRGNNTWMNCSDSLTEMEKVGSLTQFEVTFEGHLAGQFEADGPEAAQNKAKSSFDTGEFDMVVDRDPEINTEHRSDNTYSVYFSAYAVKTRMAEDWRDAMSKATVKGGYDVKDKFVIEVTNKETGEQHEP